ncbi:MAG: hypothetical protein ABFR75_02080 [Acidobacteriota bacterium]
MRKTVLIVLIVFVMSIFTTGVIYSKEAPKDIKKVLKKSKKVVKDPTVYIKAKGKKYHKRSCKMVSDKKGVKLSEAIKKGYEPCKICFPAVTVYITKGGKKYHKKDCKLVKDTKAIQMGIAKKKGYEPCKICFPPPPPKKNLKVKK